MWFLTPLLSQQCQVDKRNSLSIKSQVAMSLSPKTLTFICQSNSHQLESLLFIYLPVQENVLPTLLIIFKILIKTQFVIRIFFTVLQHY